MRRQVSRFSTNAWTLSPLRAQTHTYSRAHTPSCHRVSQEVQNCRALLEKWSLFHPLFCVGCLMVVLSCRWLPLYVRAVSALRSGWFECGSVTLSSRLSCSGASAFSRAAWGEMSLLLGKFVSSQFFLPHNSAVCRGVKASSRGRFWASERRTQKKWGFKVWTWTWRHTSSPRVRMETGWTVCVVLEGSFINRCIRRKRIHTSCTFSHFVTLQALTWLLWFLLLYFPHHRANCTIRHVKRNKTVG